MQVSNLTDNTAYSQVWSIDSVQGAAVVSE